ncbi:MAG TPA: hypothetical protein DEA08_13825 [Planctomycetes bacterium]|mgnify:CR=1 FL=1|nr:hypothetical protein [Planctomycetota bacterium]
MRQVGAYLLESLRGKGGMGSVYLGRHVQNGQQVAVKLLELSASQRQQLRFQREGRTLARLRHPGLVRVLGAGLSDSGMWLAMERLDGESLEERLRRTGPLSPGEVRELGLALTDALGAAHGEGVLHRDLKPDNILLTERGPVVIDFGLAKDLEVKESIRLSQTGRLAGTPGYWAPEQARGEVRDAGPTTDVYGLGATLYAALSGGPPFQAPTLMEAVVATQTCPPPPLPRCPRQLEALIVRCLAKEPVQRPPSMAALSTELRALDLEAQGGLLRKLLALVVLSLVAGLGFLAGAPPGVRSELVSGSPAALEPPAPSPSLELSPSPSRPSPSPPSDPPLQQRSPLVTPGPRPSAADWLVAELGPISAPERAERRAALLRVGRAFLGHGRAVFERGGARAQQPAVQRLYQRAIRSAEALLADGPDGEVSLALARLRYGRAHVEVWRPNRPLAVQLLRRCFQDYQRAAPGLSGADRAACLSEWTDAVYLLNVELLEAVDQTKEFEPLALEVEAWAKESELPQAAGARAHLLAVSANNSKDPEQAREATRDYQRAIQRLGPEQEALRARWLYDFANHLLVARLSDIPRARLLLRQACALEGAAPRTRLLALSKLIACAKTREAALRWAAQAEDYLFANLDELAGWTQAPLSGLLRISDLQRAGELVERVMAQGRGAPFKRSVWLAQIAYAQIRQFGALKEALELSERAAKIYPSLEVRLLQTYLAVLQLDSKRARELFTAEYARGSSSPRLEREREAMDLALRGMETLFAKGSPHTVLALAARAQRLGSHLADQVFVLLALSVHRNDRYGHWAPARSDLSDSELNVLVTQAIPTAAKLAKRRRGYFREQARSWQAQLAVGLWPLCTQAELAKAYEVLEQFHLRLPEKSRVLFLDDMARLCSLLGRHGGSEAWFERGMKTLSEWPSERAAFRVRREVQLLLSQGRLEPAKALLTRTLALELHPMIRNQLLVQRSLIHMAQGERAGVLSLVPAGPVADIESFQLVELGAVTRLAQRDAAAATELLQRLEQARCSIDLHTMVTYLSCRASIVNALGKPAEALQIIERALEVTREELLRAEVLAKRGAIRLKQDPPQREAVQDFVEAVRLAPNRPKHWGDLIQVLLELGERSRALAELERARAKGLESPRLRALAQKLGVAAPESSR